jgi:hypothetical protein
MSLLVTAALSRVIWRHERRSSSRNCLQGFCNNRWQQQQ